MNIFQQYLVTFGICIGIVSITCLIVAYIKAKNKKISIFNYIEPGRYNSNIGNDAQSLLSFFAFIGFGLVSLGMTFIILYIVHNLIF